MVPQKVLKHLEKNKIKHERVPHRKVYTAFDLATTLKEKLNKIAKTLLIKVGGKRYIIIILPAHLRIDFEKLKKLLKIDRVEMATEKEMQKVLKIKPGALLPFGSFHKLETFMDKALLKVESVLISAGSLTESLRIKSGDLHKLENATIGDFSSAAKKQAKKAMKMAVKKTAKAVKKLIKKKK